MSTKRSHVSRVDRTRSSHGKIPNGNGALCQCASSPRLIAALTLAAACSLAAIPTVGQAPESKPAISSAVAASPTLAETTGVQKQVASQGPINHTWQMKKVDGSANILINPDGTYVFSGHTDVKKANDDFDITLALESKLGAVILFEYSGNDANGLVWSKQGKSEILKDNFSSFAGPHETVWAYTLPLSSEGRARLYEEREKKKQELEKEEEAAEKAHQEKVAAEKKKELEEEQQREIAEERQHQSSGGSSVGSVLGTIGAIAGTILSFL
jgi:hypothetical protein